MTDSEGTIPTGMVITVVDYNAETYRESVVSRLDQCVEPRPPGCRRWIDVQGELEHRCLEQIGYLFGLHPLVIEDILTEQRPKLDDYGEYLFVVFAALHLTADESVGHDQLSLVLAKDLLITFHKVPLPALRQRRDRLRGHLGKTRHQGADYLAYSLLDGVVDQMFFIVEQTQETLEVLEEELTRMNASRSIETIVDEKRQVLNLMKAVVPVGDVIAQLQRGHSHHFDRATTVYFRDLRDHSLQILDTLKNCRELISSMMVIYLSLANNRLSEVMKILTIFSALFAPLTFVTGYYGMNFANLPLLNEPYGWIVATCIMLAIAASMFAFFKHRKWL